MIATESSVAVAADSNRFRHAYGRAGILLLLCLVFSGSVYAVVRNQQAFRVEEASHALAASPAWYAPGSSAAAFEPVNLPYFREAGLFRLKFSSAERAVDVDLWAQDCLQEVYLDGKPVQHSEARCKPCAIFHTDLNERCPLQRLRLDLGEPGEHLLAVATQQSARHPDTTLLWVQHDGHAFGARLIALCAGSLLLALAWSRLRHGTVARMLDGAWAFVVQRRAFIAIALLATAFRVAAAPGMLTGDVSRSAMLYAENLVNRQDLHFARVDPQYAGAAKYAGESHMHKPPGVYYQYALLRCVFGFSDVYFRYLTRVPGMLGDVLIGWVLMTVIEARRRDALGIAVAAYFMLGAGVVANSGIVGRIDSLPLAFLALALKHIEDRRFAWFLGLAVAWKQLVLLAVPWFLFRRATFRGVLWAGVVCLVLCAPYLIDDPKLFLERLIFPQFDKKTDGLAWLRIFETPAGGSFDVASIYRYLMLAYFAALLVLPWLMQPEPWLAVAITFCSFLVFGKNVHEHYILWSIPPLLMTYVRTQKLSIGIGLLVGMLSAAFYHEPRRELGGDITPVWGLLFGCTYAVVVFQLLRLARRSASEQPETADHAA